MDYFNPLGKKHPFGSVNRKMKDFYLGSPEEHERVSTLLPEQMAGFNQLLGAGQGKGAGGAYGSAADFYYDILNNDPEMLNQLFAPEMRRFNQDIMPGLAEQFAGMGSGALSSSGFRNSATQAGTDLSERLAQMRMNLRQNAAQGLQNIGGAGLGNFSQDVMTNPGSPGFLSSIAPAVGGILGTAVGGPMGGAIGAGLGSGVGNAFGGNRPIRNSSPYGGV